MKRLFIHICIAIALVAGLCGCGGASPKNSGGRESLFVTIAPLRTLVGEIVGEDFDIEVLVPAGASPESFEPTPKQFIALNDAQMVFAVGLIDFESNLTSKIRKQGRVVDLSRGIDLIAGSCSHNHAHHNCNHAHHAHGIDPHIWTSPATLKVMARNAYSAIASNYPDSAKYNANYEALAARLDSLDGRVRSICSEARTRQFVIYHPALTYLARDYGLEQISVEHEGKEPSAKRLSGIIDNARSEGVKCIFYQSTYPRSTVEVIAEDINAEPVEIDPLREDIFVNIEEITRLITE